MPLAAICIECGEVTSQIRKSRCFTCARERDRDDPYQKRSWRKLAKSAKASECAVCQGTERLTAHHSHARRDGGPDTEANLVTLCGSCHSQYEADKRAEKQTHLRAFVEAL